MRRLPSAVVATLLFVSASAAADMTKDQCIEANARAQDLRRDHSLTLAHEQFRMCADTSCPAIVRNDCIKRLDEVESVQPTIAFEVKDASGADVTAVKVMVDGKPVPEKLYGTALPLDPGRHRASFEAPGLIPVTRDLVLTEGDRGRRENVVLMPVVVAAAPPASAAPMGTQRLLGVIAGGAGVVGIVVGSVFGVMTLSKKSDQESVCANPSTCTTAGHTQALSDHSSGITDGTVSTVAMIAGAALLAGGAALFFTARSPEGSRTALLVVPDAGPGGGGLIVAGRF